MESRGEAKLRCFIVDYRGGHVHGLVKDGQVGDNVL